MRFGLVGTGPWAELAHGPGLVAAPDVELVGVWGRDPGRAGRLADSLGVGTFATYDDLLGEVEAVAFAVPPDVQCPMALTAARSGHHLLLDKPVALDAAAARGLADAVAEAGVASVVFFTDRFAAETRAWFDEVRTTGGWQGGWVTWLSALQAPDCPFGGSPWRLERGALWDTAPHALSTLTATLGPIHSISATGGAGDLVALVMGHESGATSTATLSQFVPLPAEHIEATVWGAAGLTTMPPSPESRVEALVTAAEELVAAAASGRRHEVDVEYGARVVELLAEAAAQLDQQ